MKLFFTILIPFFIYSYTNAQYNILFIESDDQSNQAVSAYGNPNMKTPNIDTLVKEGTSFMNAYNMGCWSPAVCTPSRTMLFYGKHIWDAKKITKEKYPITLTETLKNKGYQTYITGKWHALGRRPEEIFDELGTITKGQLKTYHTNKGHATDITGQEATNYIKNYHSDKPFFAYVAFNAPHVPRQTAQKYYNLYPPSLIKLPPSVIDGSPLNPNIKYNYYKKPPLKISVLKNRVQQNNAMVSHMDVQIGNILQALKNKGLYDKTIIVFTSDHGINFGENGVAGKVCVYEPSVTAPLVIKGPSIPVNKKITQRVYLQDINPTLVDIVEAKKQKDSFFNSLLPLIKNNKEKERASIYLAMFDTQRSIIANNQKLILFPKSKKAEFYDLSKDPWETKNLIRRKKEETKILFQQLLQWQQKVGDSVVNLPKIFKKYL